MRAKGTCTVCGEIFSYEWNEYRRQVCFKCNLKRDTDFLNYIGAMRRYFENPIYQFVRLHHTEMTYDAKREAKEILEREIETRITIKRSS